MDCNGEIQQLRALSQPKAQATLRKLIKHGPPVPSFFLWTFFIVELDATSVTFYQRTQKRSPGIVNFSKPYSIVQMARSWFRILNDRYNRLFKTIPVDSAFIVVVLPI